MMHSLDKPQYDFSRIYDICVNSRNDPVRVKLQAKKHILETAVNNYDTQMQLLNGHGIQTVIDVNREPEIEKELKKLYSDKLVSSNSPARGIYDKILVSSMLKSCCFCSYEDPAELDHFLPKTKFSEFSVAPINLVPVCHRCNKAKKEYVPVSIEGSFIHPYYESCTEDILWLGASVSFIGNAPSILYFVLNSVPPPLKTRLTFQLDKLNLNKRYSLQADRELTSRQRRWKNAYNDEGVEGVRIDLIQEHDSESEINKNSWKSALYSALIQSDIFCEMNWDF